MSYEPSNYVKTSFSICRTINHIPDVQISLTVDCWYNKLEYSVHVSKLIINGKSEPNQYNDCCGHFNIKHL